MYRIKLTIITISKYDTNKCKWTSLIITTAALTEASITTSGKAEALISPFHVKRSRYAHQVNLVALHEVESI